MRKVYVAVTNDKYELPIAVTDTGREMARFLGIKPASLYSYISRNENPVIGNKVIVIIVEIEED